MVKLFVPIIPAILLASTCSFHVATGEKTSNYLREGNNNKDNKNDLYKDPMINEGFFQGDIKLPPGKTHRDLGSIPIQNRIWNSDLRDGYYWITVRIASSYSPPHKQLIRQALTDLEWRSQVIRFEIIYDQPNPLVPYLHIIDDTTGCWSTVGRNMEEANTPDGQYIGLQSSGGRCMVTSTIQHEVMHALGFVHEQSRTDRDHYIDIVWENIMAGAEDQFAMRNESHSLGTKYDYNSIMHYPASAYSANGQDTIRPKYGNVIANPDTASWPDILQIRLMYQCVSGPRQLQQYYDERCSADCQCWHNQLGCGNDDSLCNGDLECSNNKCVLRTTVPSTTKTLDYRNYYNMYGWWHGYMYVPGAMFDIQVRDKPIKIKNLRYQGISGAVWVDVYTKKWSHIRYSELRSAWTYKGRAFLDTVSSGASTLISPNGNTDLDIQIGPGETQGFYIQTVNCGTDCNKLRVWRGEYYAQPQRPIAWDSTAEILEGCDLNEDFRNGFGSCRDERGGESFTFWGGLDYVIV